MNFRSSLVDAFLYRGFLIAEYSMPSDVVDEKGPPFYPFCVYVPGSFHVETLYREDAINTVDHLLEQDSRSGGYLSSGSTTEDGDGTATLC